MFRSAIIGLGAIHGNHVRAIEATDNANLVCACDSDPEVLKTRSAALGVPGYTDFTKMLQNEAIDVVHICTPHYLHAPMAIAAMEHGAHVLVEKPMGMNSVETSAMQEVSLRTGKRLGVCFQNRYNPTSQAIRSLLDSGETGRLLAAKMIVTWNRDEAYYAQAAWRGTWSQEGGGVLINQAIHTLDLMQWFAGMPICVEAQTSAFRLGESIEVEDTAHGYFHYADGATGIFYATNAFGAHSPIELELVYEKARIHLKQDLTVEFSDGRVLKTDDHSLSSGPKSYWGDGHTALIRDYYQKLASSEAFPIDGREASKAVHIIESIYRSAATGQRIIL